MMTKQPASVLCTHRPVTRAWASGGQQWEILWNLLRRTGLSNV